MARRRTMEQMADQFAEKAITKAIAKEKMQKTNLPTVTTGFEDNFPMIKQTIKHGLHWFNYEVPRDLTELLDRVNEFFAYCADNEVVPTMEMFSLAMGTVRAEVSRWVNQQTKGPVYSRVCQKAIELISAMDADMALHGKIQPVVYIFRSKNYYGLKDQADIVVNQADGIEHKTADELKEKYKQIIDIETEIE